jgi:hypothetical protein
VTRGHRAGRVLAERGEIVRILSGEPFLCWDCRTARFRVEYDLVHGRHVVALYHLAECPAHWSSWSARAADDYLRALLIIGGMTLAEYCDVTGAHR